jgi:hypothetical protein
MSWGSASYDIFSQFCVHYLFLVPILVWVHYCKNGTISGHNLNKTLYKWTMNVHHATSLMTNYHDHCCYSCSRWPHLPGPHLSWGPMRTVCEEILYYCYVKTNNEHDLLGLMAPSSCYRRCLSCHVAVTLKMISRFHMLVKQ